MKKLVVYGTKVLIQPDEAPEKSKGGIIIPDDAKPSQHEGTLVVIGDEVSNYQVGDKVLFVPHSGTDITYEGKKYKTFDQSSILAKVVEE